MGMNAGALARQEPRLLVRLGGLICKRLASTTAHEGE
jgi:hypothetical protein